MSMETSGLNFVTLKFFMHTDAEMKYAAKSAVFGARVKKMDLPYSI